MVWVKPENEINGWREAGAYHCRDVVHASVKNMVLPLVVGHESDDSSNLMLDLQHRLYFFERYGIILFALSGLDIALLDTAVKLVNQLICTVLGGQCQVAIMGYASLFN